MVHMPTYLSQPLTGILVFLSYDMLYATKENQNTKHARSK